MVKGINAVEKPIGLKYE